MTEPRYERALLLIGFLSTFILLFEAWTKAPAHDEVAQFYASVATVRFGDPAYYRVNPPIHRWIGGVPVELLCDVPIPDPYPASEMNSGDRQEFPMGTRATKASPNRYHWHFFVGRLFRVAIVVGFGWLMFRGFPMLAKRACAIATFLYLTSPMILGHGYTMMPDALSGCAMILLMITSLSWLQEPVSSKSFWVGVAWGICLNTKFTFCPLYVLWPVLLFIYSAILRKDSLIGIYRVGVHHFYHGVIALLITIIMYEGQGVGVPLDSFAFASQTLISISELVGGLPSPLPQQYLMGIDEQQIFMEAGVPTYFAGTVYPKGVWWYYLVGVFAKEQLAFFIISLGMFVWLCILLFASIRKRGTDSSSPQTTDQARNLARTAAIAFIAGVVVLVFELMSWHSQMALNVRYLFPALPGCYLLLGTGLDAWLTRSNVSQRLVFAVGSLLIALDIGSAFPHYFAYINPLFGGSYRVPAALHDSNFDAGQDIWTLEKWNRDHPVGADTKRYFIYFTEIDRSVLELPSELPSNAVLEALVNARGTGSAAMDDVAESTAGAKNIEIVIARCLQVPAPWHRLWDESSEFHLLIHKTATIYPDEFITPTMLLYRFSYQEPKR